MTPKLQNIDHIHIFVTNRVAAESWYARVLGLHRVPAFESWAPKGDPLTIGNSEGRFAWHYLSVSQEKTTVVALGATAAEFMAWRLHLSAEFGYAVEPVDHALSWSLYFYDPDGNPFEITTYEYQQIAETLAVSNA